MQNNSLKNEILKAIESGKVQMQPKWKYVLRTGLLAVGIVLIALTALYVASFTVFMLRHNGVWFAPNFGLRGIRSLLGDLPWALVLCAAVFMLLLELLMRHYAFTYGKPLLYSVFGILAFVTVGGIVIGFTPLHQRLYSRAEHGILPLGGPLYHNFGLPPGDLTVGKIVSIKPPGCELENGKGEKITVTIDQGTQLPPEPLTVGDLVVVLGERDDGKVTAQGIQKPTQLPPPPRFEKP